MNPTEPENVRADLGGWISGPSLSADSPAELVTAGDVQPGDTLLLGGSRAEVTDIRPGDYWLTASEHRPGVAIGWRSGSSSGVMFRLVSDFLLRARKTDPGNSPHNGT